MKQYPQQNNKRVKHCWVWSRKQQKHVCTKCGVKTTVLDPAGYCDFKKE